MREELLRCRLCGGRVSSKALRCPHCGSPSFKPEEYVRRAQMERQRAEAAKKEEERRKREAYLRQCEIMEGPEIRVRSVGAPSSFVWQKNVRFDGKPWSGEGLGDGHGHVVEVSEEYVPTHVRLKPGRHTVTYVTDREFTIPFVLTAASRTITLRFFESRGLFSGFVCGIGLVGATVE